MRTVPFLVAFLLASGAPLLRASPTIDGVVSPGEYAESVSLAGGSVTVSWSFEGSSASFAISSRSSGWVALGFGAAGMMEGADMAVGSALAGATGLVVDCYSTGPTGPHPSDAELGGKQNLEEAAVSERDGVTVMELRRPLAANETTDKPVAAGDRFIWAIGEADDLEAMHLAAGRGLLGSGGGSAAPTGRILYVLPHALPLTLSFLAMAAGMLVARFGRKSRNWLSIHKPLGISAAFVGIVGLGLGIRMVAVASGTHLRVPHTWLGVIALVSVAAAPLLGQWIFRAKKGKPVVRRNHRWVGRTAILLMAATIVMGLLQVAA